MKNKVIIILSVLLLTSLTLSYFLYSNTVKLKEDLAISVSNEKAYISKNDSLVNRNLMFKRTINELYYTNDSLLIETEGLRRKLKIKDREIKQLQYIASTITKTDTVVFNDTIFIDPKINGDTIVGDQWYKLGLKLEYPNVIVTTPEFKSEKFVVINYRKETIKPPHKCWLVRIFQRRHKVVEVNIEEKNPYIINTESKFIEIIE